MSRPIDLGLGLLDHQIVDCDGLRCGKVDDLEVAGVRDGKPVVAELLVGRRRKCMSLGTSSRTWTRPST
jgi:hypothetical protein